MDLSWALHFLLPYSMFRNMLLAFVYILYYIYIRLAEPGWLGIFAKTADFLRTGKSKHLPLHFVPTNSRRTIRSELAMGLI